MRVTDLERRFRISASETTSWWRGVPRILRRSLVLLLRLLLLAASKTALIIVIRALLAAAKVIAALTWIAVYLCGGVAQRRADFVDVNLEYGAVFTLAGLKGTAASSVR